MIREWAADDDLIAVYDDVTRKIFYKDSAGTVQVAIRDADESELATVATLFPLVTQAQLQRKQAIIGALSAALNVLRTATADQRVTQAEFLQAQPTVIQAMFAYRDYPDQDDQVDKLALLVVTQVAFAYSSMLGELTAYFDELQDAYSEAFADIQDLKTRVAALEP